jgi:hypothetical protein
VVDFSHAQEKEVSQTESCNQKKKALEKEGGWFEEKARAKEAFNSPQRRYARRTHQRSK